MKRLSLLAVLLASVVLSACGGGGGDTPSSVAKTWNEAGAAGTDVAKVKSLTCAAYQPVIEASMTAASAAGVKIDTSGLKYEEQNVTATSATVRVSGKIKMTMAGQSTDQDFDQPLPMIKEGGKWVACPTSP